MSRLALTLALAAALAAGACGPPTEPRTTIAGSGGGPRVLFEDELRSPRNWPAAWARNTRTTFSPLRIRRGARCGRFANPRAFAR